MWKNTSVVPNESWRSLWGFGVLFVCVCKKRLGAAGIKELQIWGESLTACWDHAHSSYSIERQQRPLDRTKPHTKKCLHPANTMIATKKQIISILRLLITLCLCFCQMVSGEFTWGWFQIFREDSTCKSFINIVNMINNTKYGGQNMRVLGTNEQPQLRARAHQTFSACLEPQCTRKHYLV